MDPTVTAALIGVGAAIIGVGGTVAVAITSARNTRLTNQATIDAAHADAKLTLGAAREAQYADRYSRALEQLGNDNQGVRIGGIYALEGLALDSPRNHPTVVEVLIAYIREHTKSRLEDSGSPRADVQAALTVIGRRKAEHDIRPVDLASTDLRGANLREANLKGAWLVSADLRFAILTLANLDRAELAGADLRGAHLFLTSLRTAELAGAQVDESTNFDGALLDGASWHTELDAPNGWIAELDFHNQSQSRLRVDE